MGFVKNLALNLKSNGPAAMVIVWLVCITLLGLYGEGQMASAAFALLALFGGVILAVLASKPG